MFTVRRWWERYGTQLVLTGLVLTAALFIRQTDGAIIAEIYQWVARPFEQQPPDPKLLTSAKVDELEGKLKDLEQENGELKKLLNYTKNLPRKSIAAPIIGRSVDHWWKQITLGRGSDEGIKVGYIVSSPGGLVGRVVQVTPSTSRVLLVSDPTSKVGVAIASSRSMGFLRGNGKDGAVMEFFDKVLKAKPGDPVVTSQVSHLFPPGLSVGIVETVDAEKSPAPEAIIRLTALVENIEWVAVHPFDPQL